MYVHVFRRSTTERLLTSVYAQELLDGIKTITLLIDVVSDNNYRKELVKNRVTSSACQYVDNVVNSKLVGVVKNASEFRRRQNDVFWTTLNTINNIYF